MFDHDAADDLYYRVVSALLPAVRKIENSSETKHLITLARELLKKIDQNEPQYPFSLIEKDNIDHIKAGIGVMVNFYINLIHYNLYVIVQEEINKQYESTRTKKEKFSLKNVQHFLFENRNSLLAGNYTLHMLIKNLCIIEDRKKPEVVHENRLNRLEKQNSLSFMLQLMSKETAYALYDIEENKYYDKKEFEDIIYPIALQCYKTTLNQSMGNKEEVSPLKKYHLQTNGDMKNFINNYQDSFISTMQIMEALQSKENEDLADIFKNESDITQNDELLFIVRTAIKKITLENKIQKNDIIIPRLSDKIFIEKHVDAYDIRLIILKELVAEAQKTDKMEVVESLGYYSISLIDKVTTPKQNLNDMGIQEQNIPIHFVEPEHKNLIERPIILLETTASQENNEIEPQIKSYSDKSEQDNPLGNNPSNKYLQNSDLGQIDTITENPVLKHFEPQKKLLDDSENNFDKIIQLNKQAMSVNLCKRKPEKIQKLQKINNLFDKVKGSKTSYAITELTNEMDRIIYKNTFPIQRLNKTTVYASVSSIDKVNYVGYKNTLTTGKEIPHKSLGKNGVKFFKLSGDKTLVSVKNLGIKGGKRLCGILKGNEKYVELDTEISKSEMKKVLLKGYI